MYAVVHRSTLANGLVGRCHYDRVLGPLGAALHGVQHSIKEGACALVFGMGEYLLWIALLDDASLIDEHHTVRHRAGKTHLVGDYNHRPSFFGKRAHHA